MLEQLRRNSRSFIIWVIFGIIIAAFVFTFGSQGGLQQYGADQGDHVMEVDGQGVSAHSWRFGLRAMSGSRQGILDQLLAREILAQAAEKAGLTVNDDLANNYIRQGFFWILGNKQSGQNLYMEKGFEGGDPQKPLWLFEFRRLDALVQSWGLPSVAHFVKEQRRELLAQMMRDTLMSSAVASEDEARTRFAHQRTTATIDVVLFRPFEYRRRQAVTEDDVAAYLASHDAEVRAKYQEDERTYKEVGPQARVRQIMFKRQAPGEPGSEGGQPDPGKVAADAAHAKLVGGADFATLAAEVSEDERTKSKGGDLGWKSIKSPALGSQELADALAGLEVGAVSGVIETPRGFFILKVEDKREGDLTYDQVKQEIAERMAGEHYAREAARRDAQAALDQAKAGKKLDELFERQESRPVSPGGFDPSQLPPELLQQLTPEQLQQLLQQANEQGALSYESPAIPAESMWQGGTPGAAADQAAPAQPAAPPASEPAALPVTEAPGAAGTAPQISDAPAPKVQRIGPFRREADGDISGLGESKELVDAIFDQLSADDLAGQVYEVSGNFVVLQVVERKNPDMSEFDDEQKAQLVRSIASERGYILYSDWVKARCRALVSAGKVGINKPFLAQFSEDSSQPFQYQACTTLQ